jgi:AcrR family transcriptional regulator
MKQAGGHKDAYKARNRAALLKSAQLVLAEVGLGATIEDLADKAQVSPATIYNHFGSREEFLKEALDSVWQEWILWAYDGRPEGENLETMMEVCRKMFRINRTHTLFGQVLNKTFNDSSFVFDALRPSVVSVFKSAAKRGGFDSDDFEMRIELWGHCVVGIFQGVFVTEKLSPEQADKALRVSLTILNLDKKLIDEVTSKPIKI